MESKRVEDEYGALMEENLWALVYQNIGQRCQTYPYSCIEARKTANKPLNRYRDVNPYDHSRIILRKEKVVTNYINANIVKINRANRNYILTQGPLVYTSGHFWLMAWEQNSPAIIMLNKIIEKNEIKCHWYWPHENGDAHKVVYPDVNISIMQIKEMDYNYYTIRQLKMTNHDTNESREIWHFHYTTWPDFEVPQSPHAFLEFLARVREYGALDSDDDKGPAIVHCSAGIGRSGTFCLVDSVLVLIEKEGQENVDIQEILLDMRRYRMGLIQTSEQLRFSYTAIVEGIKRLDPNYVPSTDTMNDSIYSVVEDETPPPRPPPRGESLTCPPVRPLPAIPASASLEWGLYARRRACKYHEAAKAVAAAGQHSEVPTLASLAAAAVARNQSTSTKVPSLALIAASVVLEPCEHLEDDEPIAPPQLLQSFEPPTADPSLETEKSVVKTATYSQFHGLTQESVTVDRSADERQSSQGGSVENVVSSPLATLDAADFNNIDLSDDSDVVITPPRFGSPRDTPSPEFHPHAEEEESIENADTVESEARGEGGAGEGARRRRRAEAAALAERVASMKKRSRDADRWHSSKRSLFAFSVGILCVGVAGVIIYVYSKH